MARKTRVSFIRGMTNAATVKDLTVATMQIIEDVGTIFVIGTGSKLSIKTDKHTPRTASHKHAKKATTHGYVLYTARVRKKKRRDVDVTVAL
jgi:hypothetical protein